MSQVQKAQQAVITLKDGNWDEKSEQALQSAYSGRQDNERLGKMVKGKSAAAVRSKLVSLGVYEKNEPKAVGGASGTRKLEFVRGIETMLSMKTGSLDSLEKSRKDELEALANALTKVGDKAE